MNTKFKDLLTSPNTIAKSARFLTILTSLWLAIQVTDHFVPGFVPTEPEYLVIYLLISVCLFLLGELIVSSLDQDSEFIASDPENRFTDGVIEYAKSLAECSPPKDRAILELYSWSTRPLHLMAKHHEREMLGRIALGSAAALEDTLIQASVLIDDLGWSIYQQGRVDEAKKNVEEGLRLLASCNTDEEQKAVIDEMALKGKRHLAGMNFVASNDIQEGLANIEDLAPLVEQLPLGIKGVHQAQLLYLEASFIYKHLEATNKKNTVLDKTGSKYLLLKQGLQKAGEAEDLFKSFAEVDRQAKALNLYVNLLDYDSNESANYVAKTRLERLKKVVSRNLSNHSG